MKKFAAFTVAACVAVSAFGTTAAEARGGGGAVAAGVIGGLAAGALIGAAMAEAHEGHAYREGPAYGGYDRPAPAYGYAYGPPPPVRYRPTRVVRDDEFDDAPIYRSPRVVRSYDGGPEAYGYRAAGYGPRRDCDRPHGYGGW